jgi:hypothetical protein
MKLNTARIITLALGVAILSSCSPRLVGTWTVQRFETTTAGKQGVALKNIGTIQFKKNGTGEKNISYPVLGATHRDQTPFSWKTSGEKYVTIESQNSDFARTWIVLSNKKKFQRWETTDGATKVQVIELKK